MLDIENLRVSIGDHEVLSIDDLHLPLQRRTGLVGESGSGKSMTALSILGLLPAGSRVSGSIRFEGRELTEMSASEISVLRRTKLSIIFQDPLKALNPVMKIGRQVAEAVRLHDRVSHTKVRSRTLELLHQVQLEDVVRLMKRYPHQLSGGQRQRVLIAMAIASDPTLLIADEPTTALDVTVQKGILELLVRLSEQRGMALLFISHDLGVVRFVAPFIAVIYGGHIMEMGPSETVTAQPRHRYTEALIGANLGDPSPETVGALLGQPLKTIEGVVPAPGQFPIGCRFRNRCPHEIPVCSETPQVSVVGAGHTHRCWNPNTPEGG